MVAESTHGGECRRGVGGPDFCSMGHGRVYLRAVGARNKFCARLKPIRDRLGVV